MDVDLEDYVSMCQVFLAILLTFVHLAHLHHGISVPADWSELQEHIKYRNAGWRACCRYIVHDASQSSVSDHGGGRLRLSA